MFRFAIASQQKKRNRFPIHFERIICERTAQHSNRLNLDLKRSKVHLSNNNGTIQSIGAQEKEMDVAEFHCCTKISPK